MNHRFRGITQKRHHRLKRYPYFSLRDAYPIREYFDLLSPKRVFNEKFTHRSRAKRAICAFRARCLSANRARRDYNFSFTEKHGDRFLRDENRREGAVKRNPGSSSLPLDRFAIPRERSDLFNYRHFVNFMRITRVDCAPDAHRLP